MTSVITEEDIEARELLDEHTELCKRVLGVHDDEEVKRIEVRLTAIRERVDEIWPNGFPDEPTPKENT